MRFWFIPIAAGESEEFFFYYEEYLILLPQTKYVFCSLVCDQVSNFNCYDMVDENLSVKNCGEVLSESETEYFVPFKYRNKSETMTENSSLNESNKVSGCYLHTSFIIVITKVR